MTGSTLVRTHTGTVVPLRTAPVGSIQGTLALDLEPVVEPPAPPPLRALGAGDVVSVDAGARGRLEQWSLRYAQAAAEIAGGDRPVAQLLRWTDPDVYLDLARRAQLVAHAVGQAAGQGRVQSVRPQVLGVRTCFVADDAAEVSAHLRYGARSRALAMRFEVRGSRWICVALEFA
ncbi:Rv3235 family protein [Nocardioides taihuensis]|uniref:Rv3235 family protein n=1 Tax=Nocardioides taihuensis TaxID=1835606 RepID=A0ABW0BMH3_9ACTN